MLDLAEHDREGFRGVREVRIHLYDDVCFEAQRLREPCLVGGTEALLLWAVQDVEARLVLGELFRELAGSVWRIVIDDQDLDARILGEDARDEIRQVFDLIVGGNDDDTATHASLRG